MHRATFLVLVVAATALGSVACERGAVGPVEPVASGAELEPAIANGKPDGDRHPNVGLLAFDFDGPGGPEAPRAFCAGFVVSDRVFLTAAHCIAFVPGLPLAVTLAPGSPANPVYEPSYPGSPPIPPPVLVPVTYADQVIVHPLFDPDTREHDVAVLLFPAGTFHGVKPVRLPSEGWLDKLAGRGKARGPVFTLVGYGEALSPEGLGFAPGYRQAAQAPFHSLSSIFLHLDQNIEMTRRGAGCLGDSGAPHFLGNSNLAVALLSGGTGGCGDGISISQRLDLEAVLEFLDPYID